MRKNTRNNGVAVSVREPNWRKSECGKILSWACVEAGVIYILSLGMVNRIECRERSRNILLWSASTDATPSAAGLRCWRDARNRVLSPGLGGDPEKSAGRYGAAGKRRPAALPFNLKTR